MPENLFDKLVGQLNNKLRCKTTPGVVGIFDDDHKCVEAARKMREAGYKKFDAITPFPVHGMEEAVGIPRSPIPWVTFTAGVLGASAGLFFQYWTSAVNWQTLVGGMPFFSIPAFIPVTFEVTILFGALSSVGAMLALCGLPKVDPPILDPDLTSHKFAIWVPETEAGFDATKTMELLKSLGAQDVRRAEF